MEGCRGEPAQHGSAPRVGGLGVHVQEDDRGRDSSGVRFLLEAILGYCLLTGYYILITLIPCANSRYNISIAKYEYFFNLKNVLKIYHVFLLSPHSVNVILKCQGYLS